MEPITRQQVHLKLGAATSEVNMKFAVETSQRLLQRLLQSQRYQNELNVKALEALSIVSDYIGKSVTGDQLRVAGNWARGTTWPTHELSAARWAVFSVLAYTENGEVALGYVRNRAIEVATWAELAAGDNTWAERSLQLQCVIRLIASKGAV